MQDARLLSLLTERAFPVVRAVGDTDYTDCMVLNDSSALVTGASRGIGRAIALSLAQEKVRLTLLGE
jgi:hypothetical protein